MNVPNWLLLLIGRLTIQNELLQLELDTIRRTTPPETMEPPAAATRFCPFPECGRTVDEGEVLCGYHLAAAASP